MRGDQHVETGEKLRRDDVVPIWQHPRNNVLQALRTGQHVGWQEPVARIMDRVLRTRNVDGRRRYVVAASPHMRLLGTVLFSGCLLVETLQRAVVTFVQSPMTLDR